MYRLNIEKTQGKIIHSTESREFNLITDKGVEFMVRWEEGWEYSNYLTTLSENGTSVEESFRQVWDEEPLYEFLMNMEWEQDDVL